YGAKAQTTRPGPQATSRTVSFGPGRAASKIIFNASLSLIIAAALKGNAWRELRLGCRQHSRRRCAAHVPLIERKSHARSINSAGRVTDSSPSRYGYWRGRVDGHRVFVGRLGDQRHCRQTCRRAGQDRCPGSPHADLRREIPAEQRGKSELSDPSKDLLELGT